MTSPLNRFGLAAPCSTLADDFWRVTRLAILIYSLFWMTGLALADLPPAPAAPGGASGSDFIDFFQGYAGYFQNYSELHVYEHVAGCDDCLLGANY